MPTKKQIKNILVIGKSGAGKQPRIDVLKELFGLEQISTGNIFREFLEKWKAFGYEGDLNEFWDKEKRGFIPDEEIKQKLGTEDEEILLAAKLSYFLINGKFGPDHIVNQMVAPRLEKAGGFVFDGYPRTIEQAKFLLNFLEQRGSRIDAALIVHREDEDIINHAVHRRICPKCSSTYHMKDLPPKNGKFCHKCGEEVIQREDDKEEKLKTRLAEFHEKVKPMINFLRERGVPILKVSGYLNPYSKERVRETVLEQLKKIMKD